MNNAIYISFNVNLIIQLVTNIKSTSSWFMCDFFFLVVLYCYNATKFIYATKNFKKENYSTVKYKF